PAIGEADDDSSLAILFPIGPIGHAAIHAARGADPGLGWAGVRIELPDFAAGGGVECDDFGANGCDIHHTIDDQRCAFDGGAFAGVVGVISPGDFEFADGFAIDLLERGIAHPPFVVAG